MIPSKPAALASTISVMLVWSVAATAESRHQVVLLPPVSPTCISSPFGPRTLPNQPQAGSYHYGVDLPAPEGAPVLATAPGTVIRVQTKNPGGLEMLVQHDGFIGVYSHFGLVAPALAQGNVAVTAGEKLGVVGHTGITFGAHLYFAMLQAGKPVDPAPYLKLPQCNGQIHHVVTDSIDPYGATLQGHQYYQLLPTHQYYQWPKN
jgi:murein DD-endopeptidase MepM/ murein hydrolase activator NlpD